MLTSLLSDWSFAAPLSRTRITTEADRDGVGWKDYIMDGKKWKSPLPPKMDDLGIPPILGNQHRFRNYLRFRNYHDSETCAIQKLSRFRNLRDPETITIQKLSRFRNYHGSETIELQKLRLRKQNSKTISSDLQN